MLGARCESGAFLGPQVCQGACLLLRWGSSLTSPVAQSAQGETDVPDTIVEFISQRRRSVLLSP